MTIKEMSKLYKKINTARTLATHAINGFNDADPSDWEILGEWANEIRKAGKILIECLEALGLENTDNNRAVLMNHMDSEETFIRFCIRLEGTGNE